MATTKIQDLKKRASSRNTPADEAPAPPDAQDLLAAKRSILQESAALLNACASTAINVQAEIQNALAIAGQSPGVLGTTPTSFLDAVLASVASGLGLSNGNGFLSFDKDLCTFVPGWKGLVELVLRSERGTVWTNVVRKGDAFEYQLGDHQFVKHRPGDADDHASITHYYAIGKVKGSDTPIIEVWSVAKVIRHLNKYNAQGASHYALKSDEAMESYGRKIALLRVLQYMPRSREMDAALQADAANYARTPLPEPAAAAPAPAAAVDESAPTAEPAAEKPVAKKPAARKAPAKKPAAKRAASKPKKPAAEKTSFGME